MNTMLCLPPNLVDVYKKICRPSYKDFFIACDPENSHIGSGGGTAWMLQQFYKKNKTLEPSVLIHAGGQGRRLPSYSASGKIFTPVPVYRWKTGQKIDQTLLDIQLEFYNSIAQRFNKNQKLLIASGDVLLRCSEYPEKLPDADITILTTWIDSTTATHHGVLFAKQDTPDKLDFMLQKPSANDIENLLNTHIFMMDTGCWILSEKAIEVLLKKCNVSLNSESIPSEFDLYNQFGDAIGENPVKKDDDISSLTCAIVNLKDGEFYHFGTTREIISSTEKIQNLVNNPKNVFHKKVKAQGSVFVQNSITDVSFTSEMKNIWIENSYISSGWKLEGDNVITGVPENNWKLTVPKGICIDVVPSKNGYIIRPYGMDDSFRGKINDENTVFLGKKISEQNNGIYDFIKSHCNSNICDIQNYPLFPIISKNDFITKGQSVLNWMINPFTSQDFSKEYENLNKVSADQILAKADVVQLNNQRQNFLKDNLQLLAKNHNKSVFYQCDLWHTKQLYSDFNLKLPEAVVNQDYVTTMRDAMLHDNDTLAFKTLEKAILSNVTPSSPVYNIISDQIVWGRSPVRIDIAGGWSDTPPYSIFNGGSVVNLAINLNGQEPVQVYIRAIKDCEFVLRSIDTGVKEVVHTFEELENYNNVGSSFCIPKAALCLAGFSPSFSVKKYNTLNEQLNALGGGLEITTLCAIPKGSGLGTSSILASTLLGTLSNVCSLNWSLNEICFRTLALEQLLTTGGGWQDQYGGVFGGIKLCTSASGVQNQISVKRLPSNIVTDNNGLWLLYYTGITRVAKNILSDIVKNMFLNNGTTLQIEDEIKHHGYTMADSIQFCDYKNTAEYVKYSWELNKKLDCGVSTPEIDALLNRIDEYSYGYKLAGAGGGGYLLICAKDLEAAAKIKNELNNNPINEKSRFVDLSLNEKGLQITRS